MEHLEGDGDFRSEEVKRLRDEADMVVTNPPFSLFREFLAWFREKEGVEFLIIGNMNAITYKEVFPLIKSNKTWLGPTISSGDREFEVPRGTPLNAAGFRVASDGRKFIRVKGVRWFTNIEHGRRHEPLRLMTEADVVRYGSKQPFQEYDNYDAIEVPKTKWIPSDYKGVMGVPISFMDKYCREQFEIVGVSGVPSVNGQKTYKRIFIRHRNPLMVECLEGDGDFRSGEVRRLRDEADMVVTNPPFSLFREFLAWFREKEGVEFLIIGNINAITYKEVFPLIKKDEVWLGPSISSGDREFEMPKAVVDLAKFTGAIRGGRYYQKVMGVRWFTNIEHGRRHEPLRLMTEVDVVRYGSKQPFQKYDNYDAIEVPKTKWIPSDYKGVMGVPISFLDKYCPEQFEIVGATQRGCHDELPDTRKYDDYWEVKPNGEKTGASGGKTNENANLLGNDGKKNYFINSEGRIVQSAYQRIFIRHRNPL